MVRSNGGSLNGGLSGGLKPGGTGGKGGKGVGLCGGCPELFSPELSSGEIVSAELHWYEATGVGRREFKIKRLL